jgi:hypothetical protein
MSMDSFKLLGFGPKWLQVSELQNASQLEKNNDTTSTTISTLFFSTKAVAWKFVAVRKKSMRGLNCRGKNVCFFAAVQYIYGPF